MVPCLRVAAAMRLHVPWGWIVSCRRGVLGERVLRHVAEARVFDSAMLRLPGLVQASRAHLLSRTNHVTLTRVRLALRRARDVGSVHPVLASLLPLCASPTSQTPSCVLVAQQSVLMLRQWLVLWIRGLSGASARRHVAAAHSYGHAAFHPQLRMAGMPAAICLRAAPATQMRVLCQWHVKYPSGARGMSVVWTVAAARNPGLGV